MQARAHCPPAVCSAVRRIHVVAACLLNGARDPWSCAELARLARILYAEAARNALDELEYLAERLSAIADRGVAEFRAAAELDAVVARLVFLADEAP